MKVAIVHDFLNQYGGAEKVLEVLHEIFPDAPVYTLLYDKAKLPQYRNWSIRTSFIQHLPCALKNHYYYLALYPKAIESFRLNNYDLVLSSCSAWAKGISTTGLHICYCYTPTRFIYFQREDFIRYYNLLLKKGINVLIDRLRKWDIKVAQKPDYYITLSYFIRDRIKNIYNRDAEVMPPGIDTDYFSYDNGNARDYYLIVSRLKEYKNIYLAIEAFNYLGYPLNIVGEGRELKRLKKIAKNNIHFLGRQIQKNLLRLYQGCKALIVPGVEDFGLVSIEAQACGRPVVAYAKGGARETIIDGKTGIFFNESTTDSLIGAIRRLEKAEFNPLEIHRSALKFDKKIFKDKLKAFILDKYQHFKEKKLRKPTQYVYGN